MKPGTILTVNYSWTAWNSFKSGEIIGKFESGDLVIFLNDKSSSNSSYYYILSKFGLCEIHANAVE
jgi:hypothetical protein